MPSETSIFVSLVGGSVMIGVVAVGFTYHLGWNRGWSNGFRSGKGTDKDLSDQEQQPALRSLFGLPYALGWHHGWDHGFRKGDREALDKCSKQGPPSMD